MEVLDATSLVNRLRGEAKEYWLHLEAETPLDKYPAKQHARRVQEKLGVETGLIYLPGQSAKNNEDSDMPAPFRQRRYFYYLSGCNETDCHLTYDIQHDTLSLFLPRIDERRVIWTGRGSTLAEALVKYDVDEVYYSDEVSDFVADWFLHGQNKGCLYTLHGPQSLRLDAHKPVLDTASLQPAMNLSRMIKDDHEIELIRKANDISSIAHREILANILELKNEAQVEGLFLDVCVSRQAKQQAYDPIAASGPNAGTLHYDANNEDFENRQLMCLDAGCEYELYASDITRTFPLAPAWPTKEAANIYKLVERMQESCIKRLAPGVRYLDLHILAHQIAIDGLLALGILYNGTKEEIYKAGTSRAFFPHGLGHHVGLEVHDVGQAELMSIRGGKPMAQTPSLYPESFHEPVYDAQSCYAPTDPQSSHLEEGMVVTVEPGIYFSVYALEHFYLHSPVHAKYINVQVLQHYLPVGGVRIEDDLLITSKGYENLTSAPKGDEMLSIIKNGKSTDESSWALGHLSRRNTNDETTALKRAPGILSEEPASILQPIARASTMPADINSRESIDFEPFEGPSLFSNFKRSMTTDERIRHWQQERNRALAQERPRFPRPSPTMCGDNSRDIRHMYVVSDSFEAPHPRHSPANILTPVCTKCTILIEALDRLRKNLSISERSSPEPKREPSSATKQQNGARTDTSTVTAMEQRQIQRKLARDAREELHAKLLKRRGEREAQTQQERQAQFLQQNLVDLQALKESNSRLETMDQHSEFRPFMQDPKIPHLPPTSVADSSQLPSKSGNVSVSVNARPTHQKLQLETLRNSLRANRASLHQTMQLDEDACDDQPLSNLRARQTLNDLVLQRQDQKKLGIKSTRCTLGLHSSDDGDT